MRSTKKANAGHERRSRRPEKSFVRLAALASLLLIGHEGSAAQQTTPTGAGCTELISQESRWGDEIVLVPMDTSLHARVIEQAVARWEKCEGYGSDFPRFVLAAGRGRRVKVQSERRVPGPGYCGVFVGETITIYGRVLVDDARVVACPPADRILAHELGHVLGLRDMEVARGCATFIMSVIVGARPPLQTVAQAECSAVAERWSTSRERDDSSADRQAAATVVVP